MACNPHSSPIINLKRQIVSSVIEIVRLLESHENGSNDRDQFDYSVYKLEHVMYLCASANEIYRDFLSDELIRLLLTAYNSLSELNVDDGTYKKGFSQPVYTGFAGRPALDIPRETLKLYLSYGFSLNKIAEMFGTSKKA